MTATGEVEAMDAAKIVWADSIFVRFRRAPATLDADSTSTSESTDSPASALDDADIEFFTAEGAVQVVLDEGGRVFADRVVGDNTTHSMTLVGQPVKVIYDTVVFERDTEVVITEDRGVYRLDGPGRATVFPNSVQPEGRERIEPPVVNIAPEIEAEWTETMIYDSAANDGGGSLDLRGGVDAKATPSRLEENSIKGDALIFEFEKVPQLASEPADDALGTAASGHDPLAVDNAKEDRRIRKLIARGAAELESRTWLDEWHGDKPRVFNVAGDHVEYDDNTGEAIVVGNGRLLIRDERVDPPADTAASNGEHRPFGRKGTSLFKWNEKLHMTRAPDGLHRVAINGDVEVLHKAVDGATATITCQELEATIQREPTVQREADRIQEAADPFSLGGSAEVRYLRAEQRVYIKTPTREIECGRFMFDADRQVAEIAAGAGGFASILTTGTGQTQRVERAIWDLAADAITIEQGSGVLSR
jgi:hypothetical protein